jgi:hypothetical protein
VPLTHLTSLFLKLYLGEGGPSLSNDVWKDDCFVAREGASHPFDLFLTPWRGGSSLSDDVWKDDFCVVWLLLTHLTSLFLHYTLERVAQASAMMSGSRISV